MGECVNLALALQVVLSGVDAARHMPTGSRLSGAGAEQICVGPVFFEKHSCQSECLEYVEIFYRRRWARVAGLEKTAFKSRLFVGVLHAGTFYAGFFVSRLALDSNVHK
jgi:hypothetical protein